MERSHIISNVVPIMGWISWYIFTSMGFYIIPILIYIFIASRQLFLIMVCIWMLSVTLPTYFLPFPAQWPLYTTGISLQRCIRHKK